MFRLIKFFITLLLLGAAWYAANTLQLGQKTLWGHIKAIAGSDESKALVKEVKKRAVEVKDRVVTADGGPLKKVKEKVKAEVKEKLTDEAVDQQTDEEREALRELIKKKAAEKARAEEEPPAEKP